MDSSDQDHDDSPHDQYSADAKIFRIGRFSGNEIVLARDGVADHHADLIIDGDEVHLRDAGAEAGTAIGTPDKRIDQATVGEDDLVFFGAFSIKVRHLLAMTRRPVEVASGQTSDDAGKPKPRVEKSSPSVGGNYIPLVAASVLGLAVLTLFLWSRTKSNSKKNDQSTVAAPSKKQADLLATKQDGKAKGKPLVTAAADALFMLIAKVNSDENTQRIGTAWLSKPNRLRTSHLIVQDIRKRKDNGQRIFAVQSSTGETIAIEPTDNDERSLQLRSRPKQGKPTPIAPSAALAIDQRLHLHAVPYIEQERDYDPTNDPDPHGVEVLVNDKASQVDQSDSVWVMSMQASIANMNYSGSPILNHQGQVVATFNVAVVEDEQSGREMRFSASEETP